MRVAIVHDWLVVNGGAEKVLKEMLKVFPNAKLFSLVNFLSKEDEAEIIKNKEVQTTFIQKLPFAKKYFRYYLPLFPLAITGFNLDEFDIVISSSWAVAKGVRLKKGQLHISYFQARNMKYIWDESNLYFKGLKSLIKIFYPYLRDFDVESAKKVDYVISNSSYVRQWSKIKYNVDSKVIYPDVNIKDFQIKKEKKDYYIVISRLVKYKKIDLLIRAFNVLNNKELIVIGDGDEFEYLKSISNKNIKFLGFKKGEIKTQYLQNAKAFVYAAIEDFGIAPIEALACGTPVIALNEGGTSETIIDGVNGVHFKEQNTESIIEAINRFEKMSFDATTIRQSALEYTNFKENFAKFVNDKYKEFYKSGVK